MLSYIKNYSRKRVAEFGAQYKAFGYYVVIQYPLAYFILSILGSETRENLIFRIFAVILAFPLLFQESLPMKYKNWFPTYWHFNMMFSTPLMGTYLILLNKMSLTWLMNMALGLFLVILLVDWLTFIILLNLGVLLGVAIFWLVHGNFSFPIDTNNLTLALHMYVYAILIGLVFSRNKEKFDQEKLRTAQALGGMVAHEAHTPLAAVQQNVFTITSLVKKPKTKEEILKVLEKMNHNIHKIRWVIDTLLKNIKDIQASFHPSRVSVSSLIEQTLDEYPLHSSEKTLISTDTSYDFDIVTNAQLFKHVLSNILKNSLYAIKKKGSGIITIRTYQNPQGKNILEFQDTGCGIAKNQMPRLFETFFTTKPHGIGLGLPFVKKVVEASQGTITCISEPGKHSTFVMKFASVVNK